MKCDFLKSCVNIITQRNMIHRIEVLYPRFASLCYFKQNQKCLWHVIYLYSYYQSGVVIMIKEIFLSL